MHDKQLNTNAVGDINRGELQRRLSEWFAVSGRDLPWRTSDGRRDPYLVWLSEIMLQQTTVKTAIPYFERFHRRWPDVLCLAQAPLDEVLHEWAGLGYYARARNLKACAEIVARDFDGKFPTSEDELQSLPGIGPYTAAAVAAIAFDQPAVVIDGNIERVVSRLFAVKETGAAFKHKVKQGAGLLTPRTGAGAHAEAMMDLGAMICRPTSPDCTTCPIRVQCQARKLGVAELLPTRKPRGQLPRRLARAYWLERDGEVLLRRRPARGMLGGMLEFPATAWDESDSPLTEPDIVHKLSSIARLEKLPGKVRHTFTHFHLEVEIFAATVDREADDVWVKIDELEDVGLPTLMLKIAHHGRRHRQQKG